MLLLMLHNNGLARTTKFHKELWCCLASLNLRLKAFCQLQSTQCTNCMRQIQRSAARTLQSRKIDSLRRMEDSTSALPINSERRIRKGNCAPAGERYSPRPIIGTNVIDQLINQNNTFNHYFVILFTPRSHSTNKFNLLRDNLPLCHLNCVLSIFLSRLCKNYYQFVMNCDTWQLAFIRQKSQIYIQE